MNVLFEDDGAFKTAQVLSETDASLQVETPGGRRIKIKSALVLLRFAQPACGAVLDEAHAQAADLDVDFLWDVCGDAEFGFAELAAEYFGHAPNAVESAAILLRLHSAPIHFHRKGRGRFRKAPPDILKAALAGQEKRRQQAETIERMVAQLQGFELPAELASMIPQLLYKPDRNRAETKALETACAQTHLSPAQLLLRCGAIEDSHALHFDRFLFEYFPDGVAFPPVDGADIEDDLPLAPVAAFSIDDASTTEIDDAFSLTPKAEGGWLVGIHIAAPGLGFSPGSALDAIARRRLSTVYMPGRKITMLPDDVVGQYTLAAGVSRPALSLYLDVGSDFVMRGHETRIERVPVVANLRHHDIEPLFNETTLVEGGPDFAFKAELTVLHDLACVLEAGRGKASANPMQKDYNFAVDWDVMTPSGRGHVSISERPRGSPLDKLVAELMIVVNSTWGAALDTAGIPGLYRAQNGGKVRMTTTAAPHEGLGVACYAWASSPLRRYVDLVNQWQLIAWVRQAEPFFAPKSDALLTAMRDFELTYAAYAEFQRNMERYWCLRWLLQESIEEIPASVLRESLVRLESLPLVLRVPSVPPCNPGTRVMLAVESIDLVESQGALRWVRSVPQADESDATDPLLEGLDPALPAG